ncbi:MAG TPA: hypothetical protein VFT57_17360 [Gemmatimonadaceae bacterium]|nr:hypothetical protein [Gemmatimonadaceae bacterium]
MTTFRESWLDLTAQYDTTNPADALFVTLPGGHELRGPAGTLIGLVDLVERVLEAVAHDRVEPIAGAYRWPPVGYFVSHTYKLQKDGPYGEFLRTNWDDPERVWSAEVTWGRPGEANYGSGIMSLGFWKALAHALRSLMSRAEIRAIEDAAAIPADK